MNKLQIVHLTSIETSPYVIQYLSGEFKYGYKDDFWCPDTETSYSVCPERRFIYMDDYMVDDVEPNEDGSFDDNPCYLIKRTLVQYQDLAEAEESLKRFLDLME